MHRSARRKEAWAGSREVQKVKEKGTVENIDVMGESRSWGWEMVEVCGPVRLGGSHESSPPNNPTIHACYTSSPPLWPFPPKATDQCQPITPAHGIPSRLMCRSTLLHRTLTSS